MRKNSFIAIKLLCALFICILISGCWDYRSIDEMSVVAGIAVDRNSDNNEPYLVSFEIIDTISSAGKDNKASSKLVEASGKTIYDAVSNASKKLVKKMYFGNMQILIISRQIAQEESIKSIMEGFFRDKEPRETIYVIVSNEDTAKQIITPVPDSNMIISHHLKKNISEDKKTTASTVDMDIFKIYNELKRGTSHFVLPAFHLAGESKEQKPEVDGLAVFKGDKLTNFLDSEAISYYLFASDQIQSGIFSFSMEEYNPDDVSLIISKSNTKSSVNYSEGKLNISVNIKTYANLIELKHNIDLLDKEQEKRLSARAAEALSSKVNAIIKKAQNEIGADIFGFGTVLYKNNYQAWTQIEKNWDEIFRTAQVAVNAEINISDTGFLKEY